MSAFVMVLAAGMAVGSGSDAVSAEAEQPLDLRGRWKGAFYFEGKHSMDATLENGILWLWYLGAPDGVMKSFRATDEGLGKVRLQINRARDGSWLGIHKREGETVTICYFFPGRGRPASFCPGAEPLQLLLILHRVKPGK
jgi:hypothetical protein